MCDRPPGRRQGHGAREGAATDSEAVGARGALAAVAAREAHARLHAQERQDTRGGPALSGQHAQRVRVGDVCMHALTQSLIVIVMLILDMARRR